MYRIFLLFTLCFAKEEYWENLKLDRVSENELKAEFRFGASRENLKNERDFEVFPRILDELIEEYDVKYLLVIMGQGRWKDDKWGRKTQPGAVHGAQVYADFEANSEEGADKKLRFLIEALNGILCTSLSQISLITSPQLEIFKRPKYSTSQQIFRRYGILSRETTCTENLTRLRKLLACRQSGISILLHPSKLYDVLYHASHLIVKKNEKISEMEVGITAVFKNKNPIQGSNWLLSSIFESKLSSSCGIATKSQIEANNQIYDVKNLETSFDIEITSKPISNEAKLVKGWTSQGGSDQQNGILHISLQNGDLDSKLEVSQILPYFVQPRYAKISFKNCQITRKALQTSKNEKSSALLQYEIIIKSGEKCEITIPFDKKILRLDDYPPDANHGMHIPAAVIFVSQKSDSYTIHTNPILVALPVPDFSMPFNVICFVATAFALIFGPLQLYSTMWLAPSPPRSTFWRKINRLILLILIVLCLYAHFMEINLNEVRRGIEQYLEKLNELR
ncbi:unnamed protein product [Caenorhabditis angaria]|uniref:GPI transamidase component PIG-T n=1 Tax=Caenorhabditis angaria TaxID=860376 RepID=A0A9P1N6G6_9PELO|nr:unnamed protein product [Caenorhabditis angaria]